MELKSSFKSFYKVSRLVSIIINGTCFHRIFSRQVICCIDYYEKCNDPNYPHYCIIQFGSYFIRNCCLYFNSGPNKK